MKETLERCRSRRETATTLRLISRLRSAQELRLRQTIVGPHRDDITLLVDEMAAAQYASEGQQRTVALALKIAQARVFTAEEKAAPLLLIDDIFGELDPARRNRLLRRAARRRAEARHRDEHDLAGGRRLTGRVFELSDGTLAARRSAYVSEMFGLRKTARAYSNFLCAT